MDKSKFERLVIDALEKLPAMFKHKLENVEIVIEERPSEEILRQHQIKSSSMLLGLYKGVHPKKRGVWYNVRLPDKIILFKEPIESICQTEKEVREKVWEVVIHEIGHYFGLDEEQLKEEE